MTARRAKPKLDPATLRWLADYHQSLGEWLDKHHSPDVTHFLPWWFRNEATQLRRQATRAEQAGRKRR